MVFSVVMIVLAIFILTCKAVGDTAGWLTTKGMNLYEDLRKRYASKGGA